MRYVALGITAILSWYAMQAAHEAGHVLHALVSGGKVVDIRVPLLGFSLTRVHPNLSPHFVVWGGLIWGMVIPIAMHAIALAARWRWRYLLRFFAGFCLIANGAYMAAGWRADAGDAADLVRHGSPAWLLTALGTIAVGVGLAYWHNLSKDFVKQTASEMDKEPHRHPSV